ncbi:hypothetical protein ACX122_17495 [Kosakonia cowanii]
MKEKFIEWFTAGNSGYAPAIDADGKFEKEKTQHMWEAYQAGLAITEAQVKQLAAESYTNLQGAARELNTSWMMHKTMLGAQAALLCLSQGDIKGARDWLERTTDEAFAEIPDDMTPSGLQAWFDSNMTSNDGHNGFLTQEEALERLRQRAPATDAFLASLRAEARKQGAGSLGCWFR